MGKIMKDVGKRTLSVIMALIMSMSVVPDMTVFAGEDSSEIQAETEDDKTELTSSSEDQTENPDESDDGVFCVTLTESDGGRICFYDSQSDTVSDDTVRNYTAGDTVELKMIPDDGYEVSSFRISDNENNELYSEDTDDDIFEFTMPDMDVQVEGGFAVAEGSSSKDTSQDNTEDSTEDTSENQDTDDGSAEFRVEGTGVKLIGTYTTAHPSYLKKMKEKTASILGTSTTALGSIINKNKDKYKSGVNTGRVNTSSKSVYYCADIIDKTYAYATGYNINSSLAREVYNKLSTQGFDLVYKNIAYTDSSKTIKFKAGDIVFLSSKSDTFNKTTISAGDGCEHVFYIYAVSDNGNVWMANCNGEGVSYVSNLYYYFGEELNIALKESGKEMVLEELEDTAGLEEGKDYFKMTPFQADCIKGEIEDGDINDASDVMVSLEDKKDANHISVIRKKECMPFSIVKHDSTYDYDLNESSYYAAEYYSTTGDYRGAGEPKYNVYCNHFAKTNKAAGYETIDKAQFTAYSDSACTKKVNVYSDSACTKAVTGVLKSGTTYYIKDYVGTSITVKETTSANEVPGANEPDINKI